MTEPKAEGPKIAIPAPLAWPGDRVVVQNPRRRHECDDAVVVRIQRTLFAHREVQLPRWRWSYDVRIDTRTATARRTCYETTVGDDLIEHNFDRPIDWEAMRPERPKLDLEALADEAPDA